MSDSVKEGDNVAIRYTGKLEDETVFDATEENDTFSFEAGSEAVIQGVSHGVIGMKTGDKKSITVSPDEGYGDYKEEFLVKVLRSQLPDNVQEGDMLEDSEARMRWVIRKLEEKHALIDGNHPLAGKTLIFDVELISIEPAA